MKNGEKTKFLSDKVQLLGVTSVPLLAIFYYLLSFVGTKKIKNKELNNKING